MGFFTSLLPFKRKVAQVSSSIEFNNSACKCVQQELDLSETIWVDAAPYIKFKEDIKARNKRSIRPILQSKAQRDLF
jgi:hypothetical protein